MPSSPTTTRTDPRRTHPCSSTTTSTPSRRTDLTHTPHTHSRRSSYTSLRDTPPPCRCSTPRDSSTPLDTRRCTTISTVPSRSRTDPRYTVPCTRTGQLSFRIAQHRIADTRPNLQDCTVLQGILWLPVMALLTLPDTRIQKSMLHCRVSCWSHHCRTAHRDTVHCTLQMSLQSCHRTHQQGTVCTMASLPS